MKKLFLPLFFVILTVTVGMVGLFWWNTNSRPVSDEDTPVPFIVTKGKSASQVGQLLYQEGLIRSPLAFKVYVQMSGKADKIQAGEFELNKKMSLSEIVDAFGKGPLELWVTIPEGLRREEVVERVIKGLEMNGDDASAFRQEFLSESTGDEGYLFPNTYLFPRDVEASVVIARMKALFESQTAEFNEGFTNRQTREGLTLDEAITLASIIEREAITDEERPIVAGIYLNRLDIGMALQADATTQYAVASENCKLKIGNCPDWWPILTRDDLEIDSAYNTYKYPGLPPAPIANPGIKSIEAAIYPAKTDYFYYIHADGQIYYAETLQQHNENVRKYLGK